MQPERQIRIDYAGSNPVASFGENTMNEDYGTEIFLVMSDRKGDNFSGIEKTAGISDGMPGSSYVAMHLTKKSAIDLANCLNKEIGPYYGIYRAIIKVMDRVQ